MWDIYGGAGCLVADPKAFPVNWIWLHLRTFYANFIGPLLDCKNRIRFKITLDSGMKEGNSVTS